MYQAAARPRTWDERDWRRTNGTTAVAGVNPRFSSSADPWQDRGFESFGALIVSTRPIAVERAMYSNADGVIWAAGTNATATRLP